MGIIAVIAIVTHNKNRVLWHMLHKKFETRAENQYHACRLSLKIVKNMEKGPTTGVMLYEGDS